MFARVSFLAALAAACLALGGCASAERENDPNQVSTIPWNHPQSWEGSSGVGGFNPQIRY
jgi:hypothetical protein